MGEMDSINSTGLTQREIQLLKISNKIFCRDPAGMQKIFLEYFRLYPDNQEFFEFRNVPFEELPDDKHFKKQCILVNSYMTACIENLEDYDVVAAVLTTLGTNHKKYNIPAESFWDSRNVIVEGISKMVDEETYTAYSKYWDFVVNTILKAMSK